MSTILDRIKAYKLDEIARDKRAVSLGTLEERAKAAPTPRGFADALSAAEQSGYGLIAEIKKASPSKGLIRAEFDPTNLAKAYDEGGATCLSVLTDGPSFQGDKSYLTAAREATSLPALRKDFFYDPYQVVEARALHADCILIIMASVSDSQADELLQVARSWNMDVLVEVHDADELERGLRLPTQPMIGVNNRDLNSFETKLETSETLGARIPSDRLRVSESGLFVRGDLDRMADAGFRSFLIGESLMRQSDVSAATRALLTPSQ